MSSSFGNNLKISIFGESHGKGIGVVIDSLPAGLNVNFDFLRKEMKRRQPGLSPYSTPREEEDDFQILSGLFQGKTTGTPLCAIILNKDQNPSDYSLVKDTPRPGHADYTGRIKYCTHNDYRGGGHFSGRLTAPLVLAGAFAKSILLEQDIFIGSHIKSIANVQDESFAQINISRHVLETLQVSPFPVLNNSAGELMVESILETKNEEDSLGGIIETAIINLKPGLGDPLFNSLESLLAHGLFSIPAVKGVEFGTGFNITTLKGSQANDQYIFKDNIITTKTNHNGGILGGISNGLPIIFRVAIKPTPSIGKSQATVNLLTNKETTIKIKGRHDPCIAPRAIPVIEAVAAIVILDFMMKKEPNHGNLKSI